MKTHLLLTLLTACLASASQAQNPASSPLSAVGWMAGSWKGEAFGGEVEEIWSQPKADAMIGMFRSINNGKVGFMEFEQISVQDGALLFKVKHFTPEFVGWEEKQKSIEFRFISASENEVRFEGLTLVRIDDKTCKHVVTIKDKATGKSKDVEILFHRTREG